MVVSLSGVAGKIYCLVLALSLPAGPPLRNKARTCSGRLHSRLYIASARVCRAKMLFQSLSQSHSRIEWPRVFLPGSLSWFLFVVVVIL